MKETLYKYETRIYHTSFHKNFSEIQDEKKNKSLFLDLEFGELEPVNNFTNRVYPTRKKDEKPVFFVHSHTSDTEKDFVDNFPNQLCQISKRTLIVVVEVDGNKITFKRFLNTIFRKVGKPYFQKTSRVDYISYNKETKFVYKGHILDYHKKRKCVKSVRKNFFPLGIVNSFLVEMKNQFHSFNKKEDFSDVVFDSVGIFTKACGLKPELILSLDDIMYREYLNKMGIKYPNNFQAYRTARYETQPKLKDIRKANMRLVDAFMKKNNVNGKVLKKALHESEKVNLLLYQHAIKHFGPDLINNDYKLVKGCLEYPEDNIYYGNDNLIIKNIFSGNEYQRVFNVFKSLIELKEINLNSFWDHVRYYIKLKRLGEPIKWKSESSGKEFQEEHLDWSDKISQYEIGFYERIYPENLEKICCVDIEKNGIIYTPVLLKNTTQYNEESSIQSNCVKNYIGYPSAIIFSLRKGGPQSDERATLEYRIIKGLNQEGIVSNNVQSRIKYNQTPTEDWMDAISELDKLVYSYTKSKFYENVKIKKTCKNGVVLQTEAEWEDSHLKWINQEISKTYY